MFLQSTLITVVKTTSDATSQAADRTRKDPEGAPNDDLSEGGSFVATEHKA